MTRWRPLPEALPREARHLVEQLRSLKDRTGLSLAELARRTAYSKSSWQRYLSGAKQPPRGAVQALCRVAGAESARLLALWDLADPTWPHGVADAAGTAEPPVAGTPPAGAAHRRWRAAALVSFAVIVVLLAGLLWVLPAGSG
ncbi:helix-turn-helix domain-containing protein [Streptomyces dubilierae]|uniref:Helix-turn-helix transcriptional regulator n=1 Tax=Streptomyces dubilierae TaxID=3075533 RepID=A0ABU2PL52_9ACTN|nr:helix-turn-helix transcriptional regulator [Streptomyces sp. DSM 41921]MDT0392889.1 helix-turn-helix transcriptional regulator [Streptomyces sp. DSM 41921]